MVGLSAKLWVFALGALGAIVEADLGQPGASPRVSGALQRHDRAIMTTLGLVFGIWFLVRALRGFGLV